MIKRLGSLAVLLAMLGLSAPAVGQDYGEYADDNDWWQQGADWEYYGVEGEYEDQDIYGNGDEQFEGLGDEGYYETEWGDEGLYGGETEWGTDDYGYYDQNYEWETDDEWFDGWFGESDEDWL